MHFSEALVEGLVEAIDSTKANQFYNSIKNKYIDAVAFHAAYDSLISDNNLTDLFNKDGLLRSRGTYGKIKDCADTELQKALKKLWAAQYVDSLTTKEIQAKKDAEAKAQAEADAKIRAEHQAKQDALKAELKVTADKCKAQALERVIKEHRDVAETYEDFSDTKASDDIELSVDDESRFILRLHSHYYILTREKIEDTPYLTNLMITLLSNYIEAHADKEIREECYSLVSFYGLPRRTWDMVYLYDSTKDKIYMFGHSASDRSEDNLYADTVKDGYTTRDKVAYNEMPDVNNLELVVVNKIRSYSTGRCWSSLTLDKYYNPTTDPELLKKCGIHFKPYSGGFNEPSMDLIPDKDVDDVYRNLGLTKGERILDEYDSSD